MQHKPSIQNAPPKRLVGMKINMSLVDDQTYKLFSTFMPRKKELLCLEEDIVFDLRTYPKDYFSNFNPTSIFTKWALAEVNDFSDVPDGMQKFDLEGGLYAVFTFDKANPGPEFFEYIFVKWLPESAFLLDDRPHFERLKTQKPGNPSDSDEEIWIPIRPKTES